MGVLADGEEGKLRVGFQGLVSCPRWWSKPGLGMFGTWGGYGIEGLGRQRACLVRNVVVVAMVAVMVAAAGLVERCSRRKNWWMGRL